MFITVQFKDKNKIFRGKTYDYELNEEEKIPEKGSIIRMVDNNYNYICYGTRVKVVDIKECSVTARTQIRVIPSSLEES